jgi:prepilin-type N-terminal cleavage/methylation domain-containing protein
MRAIHSKRQDGFTVAEMVVVMAVIAILTVIALTTFSSVKNKGKIAAVRNNINIIDTALKSYAQKHQGMYPGFTRWPVAYPASGQVKGLKVIGGNGGPMDNNAAAPAMTAAAATIVNQDDYLGDLKPPGSPFRGILPTHYSNFAVRMKSPDALFGENLLVPYPDNPLKTPGTGMINVAYALGSYNKTINTFSLLPITGITTPAPTGLAAGFPVITNLPYRYSIYAYMWDYYTDNPTNKLNYPQGNFAYIPLGLSDPSGEFATAYWLIGYGDEDTLKDSPYNELLNNANFPNFPPPMGDGDPTTPPVPGSYEFMVRHFVKGALVIKATKYEDQISIDRR